MEVLPIIFLSSRSRANQQLPGAILSASSTLPYRRNVGKCPQFGTFKTKLIIAGYPWCSCQVTASFSSDVRRTNRKMSENLDNMWFVHHHLHAQSSRQHVVTCRSALYETIIFRGGGFLSKQVRAKKLFSIIQGIAFVLIFSLFAPMVSLSPLSIGNPTASAATRSVKTVASGTKYATPLYVIKSGVKGPVVMVVGGTHGNEPAGYRAARLIKDYSVKKGTLLVLPEANRIAVQNNTRTASGVGDLNRSFPTYNGDKPDDPLARSIWQVVKDYNVDYLIDLHEGYKYHLQTKSSWGQTVIYYPNSGTKVVADRMVSALNSSIPTPARDSALLSIPLRVSCPGVPVNFLDVTATS